jgi:HSP20 family protein
MADTATKLPVEKGASGRSSMPGEWRPLESLQKEIDRLFEDFGHGTWRFPFRRPTLGLDVNWGTAPAVDFVEKEKAYEVTAELPGMDEKNIEIGVSNGMLTIKGEKSEEKEEKKKDYFLSERRFGSFERSFRLPDGVDADHIDASFTKGVLTVSLPKKPEAQKAEKKIAVKAG